MKILKVVWKDAMGDDEEISKRELIEQGLILMSSVGFLVSEDESTIKIAAVTNPSADSFRHWLVIPKSLIVKMEVIKEDA